MILAAGLTPAWQQILRFDSFAVGRVNRAKDAHWCASGKVVNVAVALHRLGAPCRMLTAAGGANGLRLENSLADEGVDVRWLSAEGATRVCTTLLTAGADATELVEEAQPLSSFEEEAFLAAYAEEAAAADVVVLTGSLPPGPTDEYWFRLLERTPGRAILDVRGAPLLKALARRPFVVKPNREELSQTVGRPLNERAELLAAMRELNREGAQWVVVTAGADAVWATSENETFRLTPPRMEVLNPIGSGDCFAAGLAAVLARGGPMALALRWAVAAAASNVETLLPGRLGRELVEQLVDRVEMEEVG